MKLAIVGWRDFNDYDKLKAAVLKVLNSWVNEMGESIQVSDIEYIVSGGSRGTDTLAERFAAEYNIKTQIFRVSREDWNKSRAAGILRNTEIVNNCTHMIAFPSRLGKGTQDSINKFRNKCGVRTENTLKVLYLD